LKSHNVIDDGLSVVVRCRVAQILFVAVSLQALRLQPYRTWDIEQLSIQYPRRGLQCRFDAEASL